MLMQGQHWWIWTFGSKRRERRRVRKRMCVIQCIIIGCICLINLTVLICYYKWSTGEGLNWTLTLEFTAQYIIFFIFFFTYDNKHGAPIKTTVFATVLEKTLNGSVTIRQLSLGQFVSKRVGTFFSNLLISLRS